MTCAPTLEDGLSYEDEDGHVTQDLQSALALVLCKNATRALMIPHGPPSSLRLQLPCSFSICTGHVVIMRDIDGLEFIWDSLSGFRL